MTIGQIIHSRRKQLGLTLEDVGKAVGVGKSTVKKWEDGYISNMKRDKIALLAKVLDIPIKYLVGRESNSTIELTVSVANIDKIKEQMQTVEKKLSELKEAVEELEKMNLEVEID